MSEWIKKLTERFQEVSEKKQMDKVDPDELKGTHAQRKDKDIDNDGDVDKSDEYLHNRRKAVKQAMKKEAKEYGPGHIGAVQKMLDKERDAKKAKDAMKKEEVEELDEKAPKMKGDFIKMQRQKDAEHAAAMGRSVKTGRKLPTKTMTSTQRSLASLRKESVDVNEAKIQPATHKGYQDPMGVGLSPSAKAEVGRTTEAPSDAFDANKVIAKTFKDMRASLKDRKMRPGDQTTGDKAPVKNDGK